MCLAMASTISGRAAWPRHDADPAVRQQPEAVCFAEHPHAGPERAFRQHRHGQAGQDRRRDHGCGVAGEKHPVVALHPVEDGAGGAPPDAGRPAERHGQHLILVDGVVGGGNPQQRLAADHFGPALRVVMGNDGEIEIAAPYVLDQAGGRLADDGELDARIAA